MFLLRNWHGSIKAFENMVLNLLKKSSVSYKRVLINGSGRGGNERLHRRGKACAGLGELEDRDAIHDLLSHV